MAEIAIGVVSLTFDVFAGLVKTYQLIAEANGMPKDLQYLRVRFKAEQYRILDWANVVQLTESDDSLVIGRAHKAMLMDILEQQRLLLLEFGRYDERHKKLTRQLIVEETDTLSADAARAPSARQLEEAGFQVKFPHTAPLMSRCLKYAESTRVLPSRLRWVTCDKAKMENLVAQLSKLNDLLKELLNSSQLELLLETQTRTNYQIMQLNTKLEQLVELFTLKHAPSCGSISPPDNQAGDGPSLEKLDTLAQIKALSVGIEKCEVTGTTPHALGLSQLVSAVESAQIPRSRVTILDKEPPSPRQDQQRAEAILHGGSMGPDEQVWVEWKYVLLEPAARGNNNNKSGPDTTIERRMGALALLLKKTRHCEQLRYPRCSGYIREPYTSGLQEGVRFGLVFHKPAGVAPTSRPVSLLDLLRAGTSRPVPSMTARVALSHCLAECLERFHAVGWLHKSLRSSNILFFPSSSSSSSENPACADGQVDLARPYIAGFDYARPSKDPRYTEVLVRNPAHDLYRHPHVQGSGREADTSYAGFRQGYDIYSLGIVLLEVALWEPVAQTIGLRDENAATFSDTMAVRSKLLVALRLRELAARMGDRVAKAIEACLTSLAGLGLGLEGQPGKHDGDDDDDDDDDAEVHARIQLAFYERVVKELKNVKI